MLIKCQVTQVLAVALNSHSPALMGRPQIVFLFHFFWSCGSGWLEQCNFLFSQLKFWGFCFWNEWSWISFGLCFSVQLSWPEMTFPISASCKVTSQETFRRVCWTITGWIRNVKICHELSNPLNWVLHLTAQGGQEERVRRENKPNHFCLGTQAWLHWKI